MIDLTKQRAFFNPEDIKTEVHIIGVGAIGSTVAVNLTRMGIEKLYIYDFDKVTPHNLANQSFRFKDINSLKVDAIEEICKEINPEINIKKFPKGYTTQQLSGHVFMAVDSIELRKKIAQEHQYNPQIKTLTDFRMGLADGQTYYVNWNSDKAKENYIKGCNFTDAETAANAPRNACGTTLNIISTVQTTVAFGLMNFIKSIKDHTNEEPKSKIVTINLLTNNILTI